MCQAKVSVVEVSIYLEALKVLPPQRIVNPTSLLRNELMTPAVYAVWLPCFVWLRNLPLSADYCSNYSELLESY